MRNKHQETDNRKKGKDKISSKGRSKKAHLRQRMLGGGVSGATLGPPPWIERRIQKAEGNWKIPPKLENSSKKEQTKGCLEKGEDHRSIHSNPEYDPPSTPYEWRDSFQTKPTHPAEYSCKSLKQKVDMGSLPHQKKNQKRRKREPNTFTSRGARGEGKIGLIHHGVSKKPQSRRPAHMKGRKIEGGQKEPTGGAATSVDKNSKGSCPRPSGWEFGGVNEGSILKLAGNKKSAGGGEAKKRHKVNKEDKRTPPGFLIEIQEVCRGSATATPWKKRSRNQKQSLFPGWESSQAPVQSAKCEIPNIKGVKTKKRGS